MANKPMKRGSASQVFKEVEVKTMHYGHTPLGMARSQDTDTTRRWRGTGCARPAGVHARWCGRSGRQRGRVFQHETSFHRIIQHSHTLVSLQMSQKRKKTYVHTPVHTDVYTTSTPNCQGFEATATGKPSVSELLKEPLPRDGTVGHEDTSCRAMRRRGGNLNPRYRVEGGNLKRPRAVRFRP